MTEQKKGISELDVALARELRKREMVKYGYGFIRLMFICGTIIFVAPYFFDAIKAYAGKSTTADFYVTMVGNFVADVGINKWAFYVISGGGYLWGAGERTVKIFKKRKKKK